VKIGCPEEAAFRQGFLSLTQLKAINEGLPNCEYRCYLESVVAEAVRLEGRQAKDRTSKGAHFSTLVDDGS